MSLKRTALQIFFIVITTCSAIAQKQIDYQSDWGERRPSFPDCLILKSNVVFVHQDMTMSCDSAVFNTKDNFIEAFGNIHLWQDTIDLYGDQVYYDGNTKTAEIFGKVVTLQDGGAGSPNSSLYQLSRHLERRKHTQKPHGNLLYRYKNHRIYRQS